MEIKPIRIIWHHTADESTARQLEKVNDYHRTRNFPRSKFGFYVGYHYFIEQNGDIIQTRAENEIGAHDKGENINSIGIGLAGNFNITYPTEEQLVSATRLLKKLRSNWGIPLTRIEPHRWDDSTDCPGTLLSDNFLVNEYLKREGNVALKVFYWIGRQYNLL